MFLDAPMHFISSAISLDEITSGFTLLETTTCHTMLVVGNVAGKCFKMYALYSMYELGLSDVFCLKTFRHGTNPYAAVRIILTGPDLRRAGLDGEARWYRMVNGEESPWAARDQARQAFYVVGDSCQGRNAIVEYLAPIANAKSYAVGSTAAFCASLMPLPQDLKGHSMRLILMMRGVLLLLCPTVKFHINPNRIGQDLRFHRDGVEAGALFTYDRFSVLDIGILGVLKNGINQDLSRRMWKNKRQVLWGVVQLVVAAVFTVCYFSTLIPGSWVRVSAAASMLASEGVVTERFGQLGELVRAIIIVPALFYAGLQV